MNTPTRTDAAIGVALSGGGIRAMVLHLGVLDHLAEQRLLEQIGYLSTASGGSLLIGLLLKHAGNRWPSSQQYLKEIAPAIERTLLQTNLQAAYATRLALPWNWLRFPTRAEIMAEAIEEEWGVKAKLSDLPNAPIWAINCTTLETGRRWRFKAGTMGDYMYGYAKAPDFAVARAIAASAAFPGGISPLRIRTQDYEWYKYESWDSDKQIPTTGHGSTVHLADGGVYDNLALEPFFDASRGRLKDDAKCNFVLVSDAGKPLRMIEPTLLARWLGLSLRVTDIIHSQARALRIRQWAGFLSANPGVGVLIDIGVSPCECIRRASKRGVAIPSAVERSVLLDDAQCTALSGHKTNLLRPTADSFTALRRLGKELTAVNLALYAGNLAGS